MAEGIEIDINSRSWRSVQAWAEQRLEQHRRTLETPGLPNDETEGLRAAIRELKLVLRLPEPSKVNPAHSTASTVE